MSITDIQDDILPFSIIVNKEGFITSYGSGMVYFASNIAKDIAITECLDLGHNTIDKLVEKSVGSCQIKCREKGTLFKGNFKYLENELSLIFILTPIIHTSKELEATGMPLTELPAYVLLSENIFLRNGIQRSIHESSALINDLQFKNADLEDANIKLEKVKDQVTHRKNQVQQLSKQLEAQNEKLNMAISGGGLTAFELNLENNVIQFYPKAFLEHIKDQCSFSEFASSIVPEYRNFLNERIKSASLESKRIIDCEILMTNDNDETLWVYFHGEVIENYSDHTPKTIYGILQNISSKKGSDLIMLKGQEEERIRIGKEIHDHISQQLFGVRFKLNSIKNKGFNHDTDGVDRMLDELIRETRITFSNLNISLLRNENFKSAFESYMVLVAKIYDGQLSYTWNGSTHMLDVIKANSIFKLFQEIMSNMLRLPDSDAITVDVANQKNEFLIFIHQYGKHTAFEYLSNYWEEEAIDERAKYINALVKLIPIENEGFKILVKC